MLTAIRQVAYHRPMARMAKPFRLASRITADCRQLVDKLMAQYGLSESSVVELAVREYAEKRNIKVTTDDRPTDKE